MVDFDKTDSDYCASACLVNCVIYSATSVTYTPVEI